MNNGKDSLQTSFPLTRPLPSGLHDDNEMLREFDRNFTEFFDLTQAIDGWRRRPSK